MGVPEPLLFWPFFFGFFAYHFWIKRAWKAIDARQSPAPHPFEDEKHVPAA
jgi:hypothetical protein